MRFLLPLLISLILPFSAYGASQTINNLNPAGTLTGTESIPVWQGGPSAVRTTAQAIANLAGSGGGGAGNPGGLSTQLQYNLGGTAFGGIQDFYVQAYGAKCDGTILYSGVSTTNGSPIISSPNYTFSSVDVGAHITITYPGAANVYYGNAQIFDGTIISTLAGNATLSGNVTFSSGGGSAGYPGSSARFYHTDDTTAIQSALNAASVTQGYAPLSHIAGGNIIFPSGVCVAHGLVFYNNEHIRGSNTSASTIMLAANSNSDLFDSYEYNALVAANTNPYANPICLSDGNCGTHGWRFSDISLDGNRGSNTGSASNSATGSGDGIRTFGASWTMNHVYINFFATDPVYTTWPLGGGGVPYYSSFSNGNNGNTLTYTDGLEAFMNDVEWFYNGGQFVWNGPHDSYASNLISSGNDAGGLLVEAGGAGGGGGLLIFNYHAYSNPVGRDLDWEIPYQTCRQCILEDGATINSGGDTWDGSGTLFGKPLKIMSGASGNTFVNSSASSIIVSSPPANGASDTWINSTAGPISGGTYTPNVTINSTGFGIQQTNVNGNPYSLANCATSGGYACVNELVTSVTSSLVSIANTTSKTAFMAVDNSQNVAFGPGAITPATYLGADFTAYTTGLGLPTGTLAQRPACQGSNAGAMRFDTSTGQWEGCAGNGAWIDFGAGGIVSTNVPNQFTAGQSVTPVTVAISTSTYTPALTLGNNFIMTLSHSACPCTLANPANFVAGQSGLIYVVQSGSGSDTIGTYGSEYIFSGGTAPTLSTGAGAIDIFSYSTVTIASTNYVVINPSLNFHN